MFREVKEGESDLKKQCAIGVSLWYDKLSSFVDEQGPKSTGYTS